MVPSNFNRRGCREIRAEKMQEKCNSRVLFASLSSAQKKLELITTFQIYPIAYQGISLRDSTFGVRHSEPDNSQVSADQYTLFFPSLSNCEILIPFFFASA